MNRVKCFLRIISKSLYRIKYARNSEIKDREKAHGRKLINSIILFYIVGKEIER